MKHLKWIFILLPHALYHLISSAHAQRKDVFTRQITLLSENDGYALRGTDGYYTNGTFINYFALSKEAKPGVIKSIHNFQIGQKVFTQGVRDVLVFTELDRPVTGYLFLKYRKSSYKSNGTLVRVGGSIGAVGKAALGREILSVVHPLGGIKDHWYWVFDYQLNTEVGANAYASFAIPVFNKQEVKFFDLTSETKASLGTLLTNLSETVTIRLGRFNKIHETEMWDSRAGTSTASQKNELFVFIQPEMTYQLYDATIQGGLFRSDKGPLVSPINRFVFRPRIGCMAAFSRLGAAIYYVYTTKEAELQENDHAFGGIQLSYRF